MKKIKQFFYKLVRIVFILALVAFLGWTAWATYYVYSDDVTTYVASTTTKFVEKPAADPVAEKLAELERIATEFSEVKSELDAILAERASTTEIQREKVREIEMGFTTAVSQ